MNRGFALLELVGPLVFSSPQQKASTMATTPIPERYYRLAFLSVKDPALFARYIEQLTPIAVDYGIGFARRVAPREFHPR